ncbi:hypothetical protein JQ629_23535 [Bradyrhizobium sp. AUGA SZCCT0222]|uniref:hypothetical protein n=1 Tax=Bradyrhizobium sp. AUGA SZCCT0222 TaxID=2807668 RepID=UPI001BA4F34C|nr:hypothetical protein [Bradyrhizobium sp. AUGA SZCCT0222]MBR1270452.1 hypothetical protein [Bradyrhizobium sp. AUGA SZCCT0222]
MAFTLDGINRDGDEMKTSTQILGELENVLTRIRRLQTEADANQPLRFNRRLSDVEQRENERRRDKGDQIAAEIVIANAEAAQLRKDYAQALESERAPKQPGPTPALRVLYKRRDECQRRLEQLHTERAGHALKAAEGDADSKKLLLKCCEDQARIATELENLTLAIGGAEKRDAEERREFAERDADEKHRAGLAAADQLIVWATKMDNLLGYVGAHFATLPDLQKALAKSGANIDTNRTNMIFSVASRDRAAKAVGLHRCFSTDGTVTATPLAEAFKSSLRSAVRRPNVKGKEHEHSN